MWWVWWVCILCAVEGGHNSDVDGVRRRIAHLNPCRAIRMSTGVHHRIPIRRESEDSAFSDLRRRCARHVFAWPYRVGVLRRQDFVAWVEYRDRLAGPARATRWQSLRGYCWWQPGGGREGREKGGRLCPMREWRNRLVGLAWVAAAGLTMRHVASGATRPRLCRRLPRRVTRGRACGRVVRWGRRPPKADGRARDRRLATGRHRRQPRWHGGGGGSVREGGALFRPCRPSWPS